MTATFIGVLQPEAAAIRACSDEPDRDWDQKDRDHLVKRWERNIYFCSDGDMRWMHLRAARTWFPDIRGPTGETGNSVPKSPVSDRKFGGSSLTQKACTAIWHCCAFTLSRTEAA